MVRGRRVHSPKTCTEPLTALRMLKSKKNEMNKKVLLFLAQGFEEYEAAVFTDVIGWSRVLGTEPVDMITTGLRPEIN